MKNYRLIGLTGTTGAGKSTVSHIFAENGFRVINADVLAREIMRDEVVIENISNAFGRDITGSDGLNRPLLAERAFRSPEKTALLNRLTHPYITELLLKKIDGLTKEGARSIVLDAPQLFESRLNLICDFVVAVTADEGERTRRVTSRDGISDDAAKTRISAQMSDDFFREKSDFVIENNCSQTELRKKVLDLITNIPAAFGNT